MNVKSIFCLSASSRSCSHYKSLRTDAPDRFQLNRHNSLGGKKYLEHLNECKKHSYLKDRNLI